MATKIWTGSSADWSTAGNWSPSGVPTSSDNVYLENSSQSITAGLGQSSVTLASLNIDQSFTGSLATAASGPLGIGATVVKIGYHHGPGTPTGAPSIYINLGSAETAITVDNTGTSADTSRAPVRLYGSHVANALTVNKGKVEFGTNTDDTTSALATALVSYDTKVNTDADLFIGPGVTLATSLTCWGGDTVLECDCPLTTVHAGTFLFTGTWAGSTNFSSYGGTSIINNAGGTLTNCYAYGGTVDFTKSTVTRTVTSAFLKVGGVLKYNPGHTTITNGVLSGEAGLNIAFTAS